MKLTMKLSRTRTYFSNKRRGGMILFLVAIIGGSSFVIANQLGTKDVLLEIVDNVTGQQVGIACAISAGSISASGLSPIEVTDQFRITVRK